MKIGNLYNLESFDAFCDSGKKTGFQDALTGVVLARQLTHVSAKIFEKKFPELAFVNSGITSDNSGGFAQIIQSLRLQEIGGFTTSGDRDGNKGKISLLGEDSSLNVIEREAESTWTDTQIKQAELQNISLPSRYLASHNKIYLREVDESGLVGLEGNTGLLNHAGFTSGAAAGPIAGLTAQQAYDEIATLITDQWNAVNNTPEYMATRVVMPIDVSNVLSSLILNTAAGDKSVMVALQNNFASVQFSASFRANSVSGTSRTVAYSVSDEVMVMRVPQTLTIGEIIKQGSFDFKVDSKYRIAGLDVLENTGGRILTGL
jgi:hypothetical protein